MFKGKKAAFYTLGCKLNFSETSTIGRQLTDIGFEKTTFEDEADLYVINTCSVTENANRECRRIIRKAKRNSPTAYIIATGCFAQLKPKEITTIEGEVEQVITVAGVRGAEAEDEILTYVYYRKSMRGLTKLDLQSALGKLINKRSMTSDTLALRKISGYIFQIKKKLKKL